MHDGAHHLLCESRVWNDRLAQLLCWFVLLPLIESFSSYRKNHFQHHRSANTDDDPDAELTERLYRPARWKACIALLLPLTGVLLPAAVLSFLTRNARCHRIAVIALITGAILIACGMLYQIYAVELLFWYWIVPLATWGIFTNQLRALAEHYPENQFGRKDQTPEVFRTRDIINSWFDQWFIVTRGVNFHLSHHLCPQVPFYNLPRLQSILAQSYLYHRYAHVTQGYHRVLTEYFFQRHETRRGPA